MVLGKKKKKSVGPFSASAHRENARYARLPVQPCLESSERELAANPLETKADLQCVWEKLEDLENHNRQNKGRIVGIPENEKGRDMKFLDELFLILLDITGHKLEIEQAHRVPARRSTEGDRP